jgi:hypothetical protein
MIAANIDENNIVLNAIVATPEEAIEAFGGVWVECPEWVGIGMDINTPEPTVETSADANKATAVSLLQATDWTQIPSVSDPSLSNPYLSNKLAFDQYRNDVRQYAVYPVAGNITWPTEPDENWVKV